MPQEINKGIELRSEKVRNIIGKIPPRLLRTGIAIISLIILITLVIAYFIPYPQYKTYLINIYSHPITQVVAAPISGTIVEIKNRSIISKGEQVCILRTVHDSIMQFNANINGQLYYNCSNGDYMEQDNILFSIIPDSINKIYGICFIPADEMKNIREGQRAFIIPTNKQSFSGYISKIYPIPISNNLTGKIFYKLEICFVDNIQNSNKKLLLPYIESTCKILISNKPIFKKILGNCLKINSSKK